MSKKLFFGLVPLVAIIASFAVAPAAQAADEYVKCTPPKCPHYYSNGTKIAEGVRVQTVSWATLELASGAGTIKCKNVIGGYVENPKTTPAGGPGISATTQFASYECTNEKCPLESRAEGFSFPWNAQLLEQEKEGLPTGVLRLNTTGINVFIGCWFSTGTSVNGGPPTGPGNHTTTERGELPPEGGPFQFTGKNEPKTVPGQKAANPPKVSFDKESGELTNPIIGAGTTKGEAKTLGYEEQQIINAKPE